MKYKVKLNTPAYLKVNTSEGSVLHGAGIARQGMEVQLLACGPDEVPTRLAPFKIDEWLEDEVYWINKNDVELKDGMLDPVEVKLQKEPPEEDCMIFARFGNMWYAVKEEDTVYCAAKNVTAATRMIMKHFRKLKEEEE